MRFISKVKDPLERSREIVFDPTLNIFHEFIGGVFESNDPIVIESLTVMGYESIPGVQSVPVVGTTVDESKVEAKKGKGKK